MTDRRKPGRTTDKERRHPLSRAAKLRPAGPAFEQRAEPRQSGSRERLTVQLSSGALDRLRNAVYWTPGLTMTDFVEQCVISTVDRMERKRGEEFPRRAAALRPGRRPK